MVGSVIRSLVIAAASLMLVGALVPSNALACGPDDGSGSPCPCGHGKKQQAAGDKAAPAKADAKVEAKAPEQAPAVEPVKAEPKAEPKKASLEQPFLKDIDTLVADKCSCESAADCTCKKGQCKCANCKPKRMIQPVKGTRDALQLPAEARFDATSGVFI